MIFPDVLQMNDVSEEFSFIVLHQIDCHRYIRFCSTLLACLAGVVVAVDHLKNGEWSPIPGKTMSGGWCSVDVFVIVCHTILSGGWAWLQMWVPTLFDGELRQTLLKEFFFFADIFIQQTILFLLISKWILWTNCEHFVTKKSTMNYLKTTKVNNI